MFRAALTPLLTVLCAALLAPVAFGAPPSFWEIAGFDDFVGGELDGVSLLPSGTLALGPSFEIVDLPATDYAWRAVRGSDGALYVTTGSPGRLLRIADNTPQVLYDEPAADLPGLVVSPDGDVYVGTAPGGTVLRVREDGEATVFFETGQGYIWDMVWSDAHGLVVGTGDTAAVYAVDERGRGTLLLESSDASVVSVAAGGGRVLAGTAPGGMLLEAVPGARPNVLHDTRYEEITGIVISDEVVFFAASTVLFEEALGDDATFDSAFGEGAVFRLPNDGAALEIWRSLDAPVTSLGRGAGGALWAGAGTGGALYALEDGRASLVTRISSEEVLSIQPDGDGALVAAGLPAAVRAADEGVAARGLYISDVLDAGPAATWGEASWRAGTPGGSSVRLATRSGNTGAPDDTWSDWTAVDGSESGAVESPSARFLQWRAELERGAGNASPRLFEVLIAYLGGNRPPVVESVSVFEPADAASEGEGGYGATSARQSFPSGLEVTYNLQGAAGAPGRPPGVVTGLRTVEWRAYDPDGDRMSFDLTVRSDDEERWKPLASDVSRTAHTWDTRSMQDGYYTIRVEASDEPDRPGGPATGSLVGDPFLVDNGRPVIESLDVGERDGRLVIDGRARDELSPLLSIDVSIDYGEWQEAVAADGLIDSRQEEFSITLAHPGEGEHAVAARAVDRHGNMFVAREVVRLR